MDTKYGLVLLVAVLGLVFSSYVAFWPHTMPTMPATQPTYNKDGEPQYGAIPGSEVQGNEFTIGGLKFYAFRSAMAAASTTCAFKTMASSTLIRAVVHIDDAQGAGFDVEFGKSNNVMSTSTRLGYESGAFTGTPTVIASTTPVNGGDSVTQNFNANQWLNVKIGTTSVSTGLKGSCGALFLQI